MLLKQTFLNPQRKFIPSVTEMLQRLDESKYLEYEKYRGINLTKEGIEVAENIHEKHGLLSEFFKMIGVDERAVANIDAEGIDYHVHPQTLKKLREFIRTHKKGRFLLNPENQLIKSAVFLE